MKNVVTYSIAGVGPMVGEHIVCKRSYLGLFPSRIKKYAKFDEIGGVIQSFQQHHNLESEEEIWWAILSSRYEKYSLQII